MTDDEFETLVADALDAVPAELSAVLDNVVILVEGQPPADDPDLLGLYVGIPLTERDSGYTFAVPDQILIFRGPLLEMCRDADELRHEITVTVVHEIAHHFGIEDDQLHEWGYA